MPRKRVDTTDVQTAIMNDAANGIKPPDCVTLQPEEMPFWNIIIAARANWTDPDLIMAAGLARCMYSIETNTAKLKIETDIVVNQRGTQIMNPRFTVLETLTRRAAMLAAKIQVHAAATIGEVENNKKKNAAKQRAVKAMAEVEDDDLLARPVH